VHSSVKPQRSARPYVRNEAAGMAPLAPRWGGASVAPLLQKQAKEEVQGWWSTHDQALEARRSDSS
jgi:hypothetical protein